VVVTTDKTAKSQVLNTIKTNHLQLLLTAVLVFQERPASERHLRD